MSCLHQDHLHVEFTLDEGDMDHLKTLREIVDKNKAELANKTP